MAAKIVSVSSDDATYYVVPGNSGELQVNGATVEDTIFGQDYHSNFTSLLDWTLQASAVYKGYAGYQTTIKKQGTPTVMTSEAMTLLTGKTYQITASARRLINRAAATLNVFDNAVNQNANVDNIDYLFGRVTFKSGYTVTGPVTITSEYVPLVALCYIRGFTLALTADVIDDSDICTAQANGGWKTNGAGLISAKFDGKGIYNASNGFFAGLTARTEYILEICPDGGGLTMFRGYFQSESDQLTGNVGALEEENISMHLQVPLPATTWTMTRPFGVLYAAGTTIPIALQKTIDALLGKTNVYLRYLPDGAAGYKGQAVVSGVTMTNAMEGMNTFQLNYTGDGAAAVYP